MAKAKFCKNKNPDEFSQSLLLTSFTFRAFLATMIISFLIERGSSREMALLTGIIALIIVIIDFFFTVRRFWECGRYAWEKTLGKAYKIALICIVLGYSLSIWLAVPYIAYPLFGMFVVLVIFFDFIFIQARK